MWSLYAATTAAIAMRHLFRVCPDNDHTGDARPLDAIRPKHLAPVVGLNDAGDRELRLMRWGFLTARISKKTGAPMSPAAWPNARAENVRRSSFWKESFAERRCLVPASSFCEAKGRDPVRHFWFALKGDGARPPFAFAGMWRDFQPGLPEDEASVLTHTIITTSANEVVKPVRPDRMPVILKPDDYETWLTGSVDEALELLKPYPPEAMRIVAEGEGLRSDAIA